MELQPLLPSRASSTGRENDPEGRTVNIRLPSDRPKAPPDRPKATPRSGRNMDKESDEESLVSTNDDVWINLVRRTVNLAECMDHLEGRCTIFKVPEHIRQLDPKAYEPAIAFLGPFHHNSHGSSSMNYHKLRCVRHLLSRHRSPEHASQLLNLCLFELKQQDEKVRSCYSQEFSALNASDMALIMLLDGCFIIYLMLKMCPRMESLKPRRRLDNMRETREGEVALNIGEKDEQLEGPTVAGLFTISLVVFDLLKLENQIPFFVIQLLFDHLKAYKDGQINLVDLALQLFKSIHPEESESFKKSKKKSPGEYHHLLHLFYSSRIPSEKPAEYTSAPGEVAPSQGSPTSAPTSRGSSTSAPKWIPSATKLDRAGVKFEGKEQADSFLNIKFQIRSGIRSGRMEIPPLQIHDYTRPLFRNLIAFEQCYFDTEMYITIYALFMDCIIDQAGDVRLLHLEGILEHKLNNEQAVAELFNQLGSQLHYAWEKNYLANEIEVVNSFYEVKWPEWFADLRRDYFGNPWATISVLAAALLLLLTVVQTVFSVLSYVHSPSTKLK
ncbi:UPF0481 protein At3g47200-like [Phoenix dactylifera]|uniref:UPF0481 protein At3g47200-like n=1 Tax=Phoenix dactylifera TaxID=42345 RepID=A0A8B9AQW0_PHODC|nr:UPF0481 protein At3g47200-like [Phoenix dactylifera]